MGLFSFTQEIAMDLGTANTIITTNVSHCRYGGSHNGG